MFWEKGNVDTTLLFLGQCSLSDLNSQIGTDIPIENPYGQTGLILILPLFCFLKKSTQVNIGIPEDGRATDTLEYWREEADQHLSELVLHWDGTILFKFSIIWQFISLYTFFPLFYYCCLSQWKKYMMSINTCST